MTIPEVCGGSAPDISASTVAAQSMVCVWQVPVTTTARSICKAWVKNTAIVLGDVCTNGGSLWRCRTAGTTENTDSAGPANAAANVANVTDGTVHWRRLSIEGATMKGSTILRNLAASASSVQYGDSGITSTEGGEEIPASQAEAVFAPDLSAIYVVCASGSATVSVAAYP